ncbi:WD40-repeat-containing domain protein, partial [Mycena epipterygia]
MVHPKLLCGTDEQQKSLATTLLNLMDTELRFNICHLPTSYLCNVDMPDFESRLDTYTPKHLQYACRFWVDHLAATSYDTLSAQEAEKLVFKHFLFWLEILSLLGMVDHMSRALSKLITWGNENPALVQFASDGKRFVALFRDAIIQSAPHIYLSALALAPIQSEIWKTFHPQFPQLLSFTTGQMTQWPVTMAVLEGHTDEINSVRFSPDGQYIVSGSDDKTVRIWDTESGAAVGEPLSGHTDWVRSVSFSPDGKHIVSGSDDNTVRIWDAESKTAIGKPLEGHTSPINSVTFSPDGKHIVSGSRDHTMRIWDAQSGAMIGEPLTGHTAWVWSVAFSPDGKHIVSGSGDKTIHIWDAKTGAVLGRPLEGHTEPIHQVRFSPDGKHLVSGADDTTVRLWDA